MNNKPFNQISGSRLCIFKWDENYKSENSLKIYNLIGQYLIFAHFCNFHLFSKSTIDPLGVDIFYIFKQDENYKSEQIY